MVGSATAGGAPASDAFGFAAAVLVPTCAWLVRILVTAEPAAARACVAASGGAGRAQLSALLVSAAGGVVLGLGSAPLLVLTSTGRVTPVAVAAGLLGELACVLIGVAAGAACNPPVVRAPAPALLATGLLVVLALISSDSPASAAIRVVVGGKGRAVHLPLAELGAAGLVAALAVGVSVLVARARGVD